MFRTQTYSAGRRTRHGAPSQGSLLSLLPLRVGPVKSKHALKRWDIISSTLWQPFNPAMTGWLQREPRVTADGAHAINRNAKSGSNPALLVGRNSASASPAL